MVRGCRSLVRGEPGILERRAGGGYLSRYTHERTLALRESAARLAAQSADQKAWLRSLQEELPKFIPFLIRKCGLEFRGRILEIGAGGAWLSAELSKLPKVVEVI